MKNLESTQNYFKQEIDTIRLWVQLLQEHLYNSDLESPHSYLLFRQIYNEIDHMGIGLNNLLVLLDAEIEKDPFPVFLNSQKKGEVQK